jgi:DNA-binding beta-propeller fold protein YncE
MAPRFEVDPTFPKPLPNGWYQGQTIGLWVDAQDHVWIVHRPEVLDNSEGAAREKTGECCSEAPPILEFDQQGNLLRHWGGSDGPGWQWPASNHGLNIDNKGNIWIGGNGGTDGHVLKFTQDGKFVMQVGKKGVSRNSLATDHFFQVAKTFFYAPANEVFVADGYGNKRVAVIDAETGKMKRFWGAYGKPPDDAAALAQGGYNPETTYQHFRGPVHCADVSVDNLVYVCDRTSNRLQIFQTDGTFVREVYIARDSRSDGAVWDVAFSRDAEQRFLYVADGRNQKMRIFDRKSMVELTNFGKGGHYPGEWYSLHNVATDSRGNLYTVETYQGRRLQRFLYKGLAPVTAKEQGVPWPDSARK